MAALSFHFHGYQPGDLVRWGEPDPLKPPRFEERRSPVALRIGGERIAGRNWTDAVLHAYGAIEKVLERVPGCASVDIEPQTLAWLLGRDEAAYRRVLSAWEKGSAGFVLTPPFHPILPHHHPLEREALFAMMLDFFAPVLRRQSGPVGLWLPETAYSEDTMADFLSASRRAASLSEDVRDVAGVHLILDSRQIRERISPPWIRLGIDGGVPAIARDPALSGDFAFGISGPGEFAITAKARAHDGALVASDLESLLANPTQAERFEGIVASARSLGLAVSQPTPPEDATRASVVEFSSWSDYDEHLHEGHTSDTRWTGLRRSDGLVVSRTHGGEPVSQLWKHALTLATEQVETAVRRTARDLLHPFELDRRREIVRQLGVAYGRHLWREHYRANGSPASSLDFGRQAEAIVGGKVDVEVVAYLSRAYVTMLMGLRSDPRFWDNLDTRVTFQNVANLAASLLDAAEACRRAHRQEDAGKLVRLLEATLLEFDQAYGRHRFSNLNGVEGWVTTEAAWLRSLQSEVPRQSSDNAVARAARFQAASPDAPKDAHSNFVADTGHIAGEAHGEWDNRDWCEHRGR